MGGVNRSGGCLCGAVRYETGSEPLYPHWCHCTMCRRATGAPAGAWVNFKEDRFRFTAGEPAYYESSPGVRRGFCAICGGSLCTIEKDEPSMVCILIATLDDPDGIAPAYHIWHGDRIAWFDVVDDAPRFEKQSNVS